MDADKLFGMIEDAISEVGGAVIGGLAGAAIGDKFGKDDAAAGAALGAGVGTLAGFIFKKLTNTSSSKTYTPAEIRNIVDQELIARGNGQ